MTQPDYPGVTLDKVEKLEPAPTTCCSASPCGPTPSQARSSCSSKAQNFTYNYELRARNSDPPAHAGPHAGRLRLHADARPSFERRPEERRGGTAPA
ncbi:MAG: hypothetical protein WKG07_12180 [Hymenobacter sp.]